MYVTTPASAILTNFKLSTTDLTVPIAVIPIPIDTAENPATGTNQVLFQNFTLEDGARYEISADYLSGDATINYVVNDVDSGIAIGTPHNFVAIATAVSLGIGITTTGTIKSVVDSLRLIKVIDANVVTYNGEIVTYNGEDVTYTEV